MVTTTSIAASSNNQTQVTEVGDLARINEMVDSTRSILKTYFPTLYQIPDSVIYCMNIWQTESGFNLFHTEGNSRHTLVTGTDPNDPIPGDIKSWKNGQGFWRNYWHSVSIASWVQQNSQTPAIRDGLYAHGISAAMGAYHVDSSAACLEIFGSPKYRSLASANQLIVQPGTSVTSLYQDTTSGRKKSILAGIIVLDYHFNKWKSTNLNTPVDSHTFGVSTTPRALLDSIQETPVYSFTGVVTGTGGSLSDQQALILASGSYLGWGKDSNGATGVKRALYVKNNREWSYKVSAGGTPSSTGATPTKPVGCV